MPEETGTSTGQEVATSETTEERPANETTTQKERRILEAKVNGRAVKIDEETLLRDYAKYSAADEKFREAADLRKKNEDFERRIIDDPEAFMNDERIPRAKRREIAEKILIREIEQEMQPEKTAEQLRNEQLQKELDKYKAKENDELTAKEQAEFNAVVEARREVLAKTFQDAIALTPLSKEQGTSAEVVREMALYMRLCKQAGYDVTPQDLANHVESRFMSSYKNLTESMEGEDLVHFLGKDIVNKIRKYDLANLESRRQVKEPDTAEEWDKPASRSRAAVDPRALLRK